MTREKHEAVATSTAPRENNPAASYDEAVPASSLFDRHRPGLMKISEVLAALILCLERPSFTPAERAAGWETFERLLRRYMELKKTA